MKTTVHIKQIEGLALAAFGNSRHWVTMGAPEKLGGFGAGSRPMEVVLMGIAGCATMDILAILKKKRVNLAGFDLVVEAQRADEHPQVYTEINFHFTFSGKGIQSKDIDRAIQLTDEKYCGATAMIKPQVKVTYQYKIVETAD
jgi:putative redox protein